MLELTVRLKDILISIESEEDLTATPSPNTQDRIDLRVKELYSFVKSPIEVTIDGELAKIIIRHEQNKPADETIKTYQRGSKYAEKGDYARAIGYFRTAVTEMPLFVDARRNLGMALMESGRIDEAKTVVIQTIRLNPEDGWGYLILGNIYAKKENKFTYAEKCYLKALELKPDDPFTLTAYGGMCIKLDRMKEAEDLLTRAVKANTAYPNAYYGLALVYLRKGDLQASRDSLDLLFTQEHSPEQRSEPVYAEARSMYLDICRSESQSRNSELFNLVKQHSNAFAKENGIAVELREDNSLTGILAIAESAWRHNTSSHVIRYSGKDTIVIPHLVAHELEHLSMEYKDRQVGRNRLFASSAKTREHAIRAIKNDIFKASQRGYNESSLTSLMLEFINGLAQQLYSCPLDMLVEFRIYHDFPELVSNQLVSLDIISKNAYQAISNPDNKRLAPKIIFEASSAMNAAYALFIDYLYGQRTNYSKAYDYNSIAVGRELYDLWCDVMNDYHPGRDYELVDRFADVLRLKNWYEWLDDVTQTSPVEGTTNPELLQQKEPATLMYLLGTLERFSKMPRQQITALAQEIALLGQSGLNYASPDKKYSVNAFPGETFSGLQLLCFMYVGFKQIDPSLDTGLDFGDAYAQALKLFGQY